ncbi:Uvr/REP helicase [Rhizophagus clarus]|uniref:Uvr/REP helicase n=1 Tax=Rhizophagus clarus TaxID=94130 RepID=A0A8H3L2B2_9GLOM|nr:Uvr/REP helicase [Rhizophagus clarus]
MTSDLEVLIAELEAKKTDEKAKLEALEARILKLEQNQAERDARILILEQGPVEREAKKNRKFQTRCIQIAKEILNEEPIIEYRPPFLNGLEFDAFFQKYRIGLEVQGAQHRLHSTSWYKDVKKLEDIVNRDRQKRCICQDNGISLLEVWYDEKPEIVIPKRIQKIKEFVCLVSKSFDIQTISYKTLTPEYLDCSSENNDETCLAKCRTEHYTKKGSPGYWVVDRIDTMNRAFRDEILIRDR